MLGWLFLALALLIDLALLVSEPDHKMFTWR